MAPNSTNTSNYSNVKSTLKDLRVHYILELVAVSLGIKDPVLDIRLKFIHEPENEKKIFHFLEGFAESVHFDDVGFLIFYKSTFKGYRHYKIKKKRLDTSDEITVGSSASLHSDKEEKEKDKDKDSLGGDKTTSEMTDMNLHMEDEWQVRRVYDSFIQG